MALQKKKTKLPHTYKTIKRTFIFYKSKVQFFFFILFIIVKKIKAFEGYLDRVKIGRYTQRNGIERSEYSVIYNLSLENQHILYKISAQILL